jgi:hypothetical protein
MSKFQCDKDKGSAGCALEYRAGRRRQRLRAFGCAWVRDADRAGAGEEGKEMVRIDYEPRPDVLEIILHYRGCSPKNTLVAVIDDLIRRAHRAISGNAKK